MNADDEQVFAERLRVRLAERGVVTLPSDGPSEWSADQVEAARARMERAVATIGAVMETHDDGTVRIYPSGGLN